MQNFFFKDQLALSVKLTASLVRSTDEFPAPSDFQGKEHASRQK